MNEFNEFYTQHKKPKIWYWYAENSFWNRAEKRQFDLAHKLEDEEESQRRKDIISDQWSITKWTDMNVLFRQTPIVIKDCFKFGLKDVSKAMKKHGLINTALDSDCKSGTVAMVQAWKCYQVNNRPERSGLMKDIAQYNKFDCKVLYDILIYLRKIILKFLFREK